MSVSSVNQFYGKLASDQMLNRAFAKATAEFTIKFAAERGYQFSHLDLMVAHQNWNTMAQEFGKDVKQLHQHNVGNVAKGAAQAVAQGAGKASKGALKAANRTSGVSPSQANEIMSAMELKRILDRLGDTMGGMHGAKKKSGGG